MSLLKSRFQSLAPRRDDGSILPAVAAGVLLVLAAAQLILRSPVELPPEPAVRGRATPNHTPSVRPVAIDPALLARPLFAPRKSATSTAAGETVPLGGAQIAGMVSIKGRVFAVVRRSDGRIVNLGLGQGIDGWRLVGIDGSGATLVKAGMRLVVPFSAGPVSSAPETPEGQ